MALEIDGTARDLAIEVSKEAEEEIRTVLKDQAHETVVRVFVQLGGGCGGDCGEASPRFGMALDTLKGGDKVLEVGGVRLVADEYSSTFLHGAHIDYVKEGRESGFKITSLNTPAPSEGSCGCGSGGSCGSR